MANNPAILSKNANYPAGNVVGGYDSGNILAQNAPGKPAEKLVDGTQQSSTTLSSSANAGYAGSYLEGTNQNNEAVATITNIALTSNVLTVSCTNTFYVGQNIELKGLTTTANLVLNRANVVIVTCSGSQFTAAYTHGNLSSGSDTGTATYTNTSRGAGLSLNAGRQ